MIILLFSLTIWHLRNWIIFKRKDPKESSRNFACLNLFKSNVNLYAKRFYFKWFQTTPLSTGAIYKKKEYRINPFTNIKIEIKSRETIRKELKYVETRTIQNDNITAFTDGSSIAENAGAGVVILYKRDGKIETKEQSIRLGIGSNNFAEAKALLYAVDEITRLVETRTRHEISIHSDSIWLIMAVSKNWKIKEHTEIIEEIHSKILKLQMRSWFKLAWVPAHSDIYYNEIADTLANRAARSSYNQQRRRMMIKHNVKKRKNFFIKS